MEPTVIFRDFEERDIDFIYRCKNDEKLNSMIVGQYHPFTYEEAKKWVHGCMGEHETYKFWAIAANDAERQIVGWVSVSNIDKIDKSAFFHGIVIGDNEYKDGIAWIESYLFVFKYVFDVLRLHRLKGENIIGHKESSLIAKALFFTFEETKNEEIGKNDIYCEVKSYNISDVEYNYHKKNGDYDLYSIIDRILTLSKKQC